jgi:hypothetical protein
MKPRLPIYCFNWPSNMGGSGTKFVHLLLHRDHDITAAPNMREQFEQMKWRRLAGLGVKAALLEALCRRMSKAARDYVVHDLWNAAKQRAAWRDLLEA